MNGNTTRPQTGRLLIGGGTHTNVNGSLYGSWLLADDPKQFLFKEINFVCGDNDIRDAFLVPAMRAKYPSILFDVPIDGRTGLLRQHCFITVLFLEEGDMWRNAKIICQLSRGRDLVVNDAWNDDNKAVWRKWDKYWFRERILGAVCDQISAKRSIKNPKNRNFVPLYTRMYKKLETELK